MIAHIDQHFNLSSAVDSLGYIFDPEIPSMPAPAPAPTPAPPPPRDSQPDSAVVPGAFSAVTETTYYNSGDEFDYKGKSDGAIYVGNSILLPHHSSPCPHRPSWPDGGGSHSRQNGGSLHFQRSICVMHSSRSSRSQYSLPPKDSSLSAGQSSHTVHRTHTEAVFHAHVPCGDGYQGH
jgi:hypothetical protein